MSQSSVSDEYVHAIKRNPDGSIAESTPFSARGGDVKVSIISEGRKKGQVSVLQDGIDDSFPEGTEIFVAPFAPNAKIYVPNTITSRDGKFVMSEAQTNDAATYAAESMEQEKPAPSYRRRRSPSTEARNSTVPPTEKCTVS